MKPTAHEKFGLEGSGCASDLFGNQVEKPTPTTNSLKSELANQIRINQELKAKLEKTEYDLNLLSANATNLIARIKPDGEFTYVSPSFKTVLGYPPEKLLRKNCFTLYHEGDLSKIQKIEENRQKKPSKYTYTYRMRHRDGYFIWFESNFKVLYKEDSDEIGEIFILSKDITERVMEERANSHTQELAKATRLTTMEEMASGMAHEINQPLSAVINYTRGCVRYLENKPDKFDKKLAEILEKAAEQAERAGEITHRLKTFFSKGKLYKAPEKINRLIKEVVDSLKQDINRRQTKIFYKFGRKLPILMVDKIQLQQVILNLLQNALEAMQDVSHNKRQITIKTAYRNNVVEVIFSDTGPGFTPELVQKIYQPFFTTKPYGTGMGLPISRSIIEAHNGNFLVRAPKYNKEGWVCFTLPIKENNGE